VGGGLLKIVNSTVPAALRRLGYGEDVVKETVEYIDEHDTIEGAPNLEDQHLKVFDCAFKPLNGQRSIAPMGHVRMMAAVQPFISGSQSKTVNMPTEASVEDIAQTYMESWKLGLKCIAIYRDGCKRSQPLSTSMKDRKDVKAVAVEAQKELAPEPPVEPRPVRRRLPDERQSLTHKFDIQGHEGYITVGLYPDGTPGEIFLTMAKEGSTISGLMDAFATQTSLALQYGVPLRVMVNKFSHMRFEPNGFTRNPEIPMAKSLIDYIYRWLASRFLDAEDQEAVGIVRRDLAPAPQASTEIAKAPEATASSAPKQIADGTNGQSAPTQRLTFVVNADAPACSECGSITVRSGACYKCMNCGATTGCS
jgi:ribonucleoside-diphosphate reductase alpha chain